MLLWMVFAEMKAAWAVGRMDRAALQQLDFVSELLQLSK